MSKSMFRVPIILCALVAIILSDAPIGLAQQELRPNLVPLPPSDVALVPDGSGGTKLVFSTSSWNSGAGPLELVADGVVDPVTGTEKVYQRVYSSNGSYQDFPAGDIVYDPDHGHFHFEDYAFYKLQPLGNTGGSQPTGSKISFCLLDNLKVNTRLPGAAKKPVYTTCGLTIQGISVGWGDIYRYSLPGQSLDFTGNPDGDYLLTNEIDPLRQLLETNDVDNTSCVQLHITNNPATVQVLGYSCDTSGGGGGGGAVTVSGILPNSASAGSVLDVTITGSGFAPGMAVTFENGSGQAPIASNVRVPDANTIFATITVKNGKPGRDPVWDLRVDSVVLTNAFTVVQ